MPKQVFDKDKKKVMSDTQDQLKASEQKMILIKNKNHLHILRHLKLKLTYEHFIMTVVCF